MSSESAVREGRISESPARYTMREVRSVESEQWNSWLENAPGGGDFRQIYEWGELKRDWGWTPVRLVLEREGSIKGVGQFLFLSTPTTGKLMYCPRGPWIPWDDDDAVLTFLRGVLTVAQRERAHTVKIESEVLEQNERVKKLLRDFGFTPSRYTPQFKTTLVFDLTQSEDQLLANMKSKTRYNVRLAAKKGVVVREDNSEEALEAFYELTRETSQRDGFPMRAREYYFKVWSVMLSAGRAHLFLASHDGDLLAGNLAFTFGGKCWYMYGASSNQKRNLMPMYLVQWEVMRWAKRQGMKWYDMVGVPKPENLNEGDSMWGLYRFKSGFGGEVRDFIGAYDLKLRPIKAQFWYRIEPTYYRLYKRLTGDIYY